MNAPTEFARAVCPHDCPDTCAMRVTVENGRAIKVTGDPDHAPTQGVLCTKVSRYADRVHHTSRLTTPMKRVGKAYEWTTKDGVILVRLMAVERGTRR